MKLKNLATYLRHKKLQIHIIMHILLLLDISVN